MRRAFLLVSASACLLAAPVFAADATDEPTPVSATTTSITAAPSTLTPEQAEAAAQAARVERAQRLELNARMNAVIEASQKSVAGLQKMIDVTKDPATRRDLEKRMAQVKTETTLDLLRVQATFARENGRVAQAEKIEAELAEILNPKRAVPATTSSARTGAALPAGGAR
jgi:hypothetical protein